MWATHITTNVLASSTKSPIYNSTYFNPDLIDGLMKPYRGLSQSQQEYIQKLSNTKSCEIENKLARSPTELNRDLQLQSNLNWQDYVSVTKLNDMKEFDLNTFNKLEDYHNLCNIVTFNPLQTYFDTNPSKFTSDINFILDTESSIYNHLCKMNTNANTCFIMESRHTQMIQRTNNPESGTNIEAEPDQCLDEENEDDGDDYDPEYSPNNYQGWPSTSEPQTLPHSYSRWVNQMIHKEDKLHSLFSGYMNEQTLNLYEIPMDIINACIEFTYGFCYTVDRLLRQNITKLEPEPFSWGHYNINWDQHNAELLEVHRSKVCDHVIEHRLNLYPILNSVHSEYNVSNSMTWIYIKYEDIVMTYMYITDDNGKSYGTRLTANNIATVLPSLFVQSQINVSLDGFKSAIDPILDEYRIVLFKHNYTKSHLLNSFQQRIQDIINDYNAIKTEYDRLLTLDAILSIFKDGNINNEYFLNKDNYIHFVTLIRDNGYALDVANEFWYCLDGATMTNVQIDSIVKEEESQSDDMDLDELNEDIMRGNDIWHGEEQLIRLYQQNNETMMELVHLYENGNNVIDTNFEYPPEDEKK